MYSVTLDQLSDLFSGFQTFLPFSAFVVRSTASTWVWRLRCGTKAWSGTPWLAPCGFPSIVSDSQMRFATTFETLELNTLFSIVPQGIHSSVAGLELVVCVWDVHLSVRRKVQASGSHWTLRSSWLIMRYVAPKTPLSTWCCSTHALSCLLVRNQYLHKNHSPQ